MIDCPMCLNSSGFLPFTSGGKSQDCGDCNVTGKVSKKKYNELKEKYGDLIYKL